MPIARVNSSAAPVRAACLILALAAPLLVPACAPRPAAETQSAPPTSLSLTDAPPISAGGDVDVRLWVLTAPNLPPAATPAPFRDTRNTSRPAAAPDSLAVLLALADASNAQTSAAIDAATLATLQRNGMRAAIVPLPSLERLRTRLALLAPEQQQILALSNVRTPVLRGPTFTTSEAFDLDTGVFTVEAGHLRLLLRSWAVPAPVTSPALPPPAAVRIEATPQAVPRPGAAPNSLLALRERDTIALEAAGPLFSRLALEATLQSGQALILFAADESSMGVDAAITPTMPSPPADDDVPPEGRLTDATGKAPARIVPRADKGPQAPALPTLGQALLTDALSPNPRQDRLVVVLIPRPPASFSLLK